jgi:hypothetical protein
MADNARGICFQNLSETIDRTDTTKPHSTHRIYGVLLHSDGAIYKLDPITQTVSIRCPIYYLDSYTQRSAVSVTIAHRQRPHNCGLNRVAYIAVYPLLFRLTPPRRFASHRLASRPSFSFSPPPRIVDAISGGGCQAGGWDDVETFDIPSEYHNV